MQQISFLLLVKFMRPVNIANYIISSSIIALDVFQFLRLSFSILSLHSNI